MKHITEILIDNGYKAHRAVYNKGVQEYIEVEFKNDYSSMVSGGLDYRFIKGDKEVIYGLNEYKKPPTLIRPRPKGVYRDDEMNRMLTEDSQKVFDNCIA